jgi:hypothetical protein
MFKKLLSVVLGVTAFLVVPSVVLAQESPTVDDIQIMMEELEDSMTEVADDIATTEIEENEEYTDTDWEYEWNWDMDEYDTDEAFGYVEDVAELGAAATALGMVASIFSLVGVVFLVPLGLIVYIFTSVAYMNIAKKLNVENTWFAWIPILRCVQRFQIAGMSGWLTLLMIIPLVNTILAIIALMKTCERRGMDKLLGLLGLIPVANWILIGVLAWKKDTSSIPVEN